MDAVRILIVYAFALCVVLSILYLLIKAAVREGIKEAVRDLKNKDEDDDQ